MAIRAQKNSMAWLGLTVVVGIAIALAQSNRHPDVREVSVAEAKAMLDAGAVAIDVRQSGASDESHIPGALLIPLEVLHDRLTELSGDKSQPIVVYCSEGTPRGPKGTAVLNEAGYTQAVNMQGGIQGWRAAKLATASK